MTERIDAILLGFVFGVGATLGAIGLAQVLVAKGYQIATDLVSAGWSASDLRAHKKLAIILPWVEKARESGRSGR